MCLHSSEKKSKQIRHGTGSSKPFGHVKTTRITLAIPTFMACFTSQLHSPNYKATLVIRDLKPVFTTLQALTNLTRLHLVPRWTFFNCLSI